MIMCQNVDIILTADIDFLMFSAEKVLEIMFVCSATVFTS